MKPETIGVVNPFYQRVGEQYLARKANRGNDIEVPNVLPEEVKQAPLESSLVCSFLTGAMGESIHKTILDRYSHLDLDFHFLDKVKYNKQSQVVEGSNPFYVVAVNKLLSQYNARVATQADLEDNILKESIYPLRDKGYYVDTSLILKTTIHENDYLANDLANQARLQGFWGYTPANPLVIPLNQLELKFDEDSPYEVSFKLIDKAKLFYAPILSKSGTFYSEDVDEQTGLPKKADDGDRNLWARDTGLCRLRLDAGYFVPANIYVLHYSHPNGRIVIVQEKTK